MRMGLTKLFINYPHITMKKNKGHFLPEQILKKIIEIYRRKKLTLNC